MLEKIATNLFFVFGAAMLIYCVGTSDCGTTDSGVHVTHAAIINNKDTDLDLILLSDMSADGNAVAYDKNTKHMYCIQGDGTALDIAPIYRVDGSPKIYEED